MWRCDNSEKVLNLQQWLTNMWHHLKLYVTFFCIASFQYNLKFLCWVLLLFPGRKTESQRVWAFPMVMKYPSQEDNLIGLNPSGQLSFCLKSTQEKTSSRLGHKIWRFPYIGMYCMFFTVSLLSIQIILRNALTISEKKKRYMETFLCNKGRPLQKTTTY